MSIDQFEINLFFFKVLPKRKLWVWGSCQWQPKSEKQVLLDNRSSTYDNLRYSFGTFGSFSRSLFEHSLSLFNKSFLLILEFLELFGQLLILFQIGWLALESHSFLQVERAIESAFGFQRGEWLSAHCSHCFRFSLDCDGECETAETLRFGRIILAFIPVFLHFSLGGHGDIRRHYQKLELEFMVFQGLCNLFLRLTITHILRKASQFWTQSVWCLHWAPGNQEQAWLHRC